MLYICEQFARSYLITFNCKKTQCIKFGDPVCPDEIASINGSCIKWVDHVRHLGNYVSNDLSDDYDCKMKCATFVNSVNKLIANYGNVQQETLNRLFNIYCCTFYGSQL